ncbi:MULTISPECIES: hypothetical protein [unclassified Mycobacterium]|uniref:hypothetical protein n=1 Tax=unclassified Mycobacterium TaxID=2642494 RepID=UPI0029C97BDC|nr:MULTISPECIES: hypothetical protein [unclassified Mycobacterium]
MAIENVVLQRISAVIGASAVIAAFAVSISAPSSTPVSTTDAHAKFQVITVIARPSAAPMATVTETDKPHQLATPRATPAIRARRTVVIP